MITEERKKIIQKQKEEIEIKIQENKPKLLRCPFCGDIPFLDRNKESGSLRNPEYHVYCDCLGLGWNCANIHTPSYRDINIAIEMWNKRKEIAALTSAPRSITCNAHHGGCKCQIENLIRKCGDYPCKIDFTNSKQSPGVGV
jgi:hypothetical protein